MADWEHRLVRNKNDQLFFASVLLDGERIGLVTRPLYYGFKVEDMRVLAQKLLAACDRPIIAINDEDLKYAIGLEE